jgi:AAA+ lid domain
VSWFAVVGVVCVCVLACILVCMRTCASVGGVVAVVVFPPAKWKDWHSSVSGYSQACTANMNLSEEVDLEDYVSRPDKISNAEIAAICQEAGMHAVRKNRYVILPKDFEKGYKANVKKSDTDFEFYH